MTRVQMLEMVHYYDECRWKSARGKLTFWEDMLLFQSFKEITIPLRSLTRISLETPRAILYAGLDLPDLEFKPKNMYFLRLDFDIASVEVLGRTAKRTEVFGSCYYDCKRANKQMVDIKGAIYRARANAIYEHRLALGGVLDRLQASANGTSQQEGENDKEAIHQNKHRGWLQSILHPGAA